MVSLARSSASDKSAKIDAALGSAAFGRCQMNFLRHIGSNLRNSWI
jgi:hypothetical protein